MKPNRRDLRDSLVYVGVIAGPFLGLGGSAVIASQVINTPELELKSNVPVEVIGRLVPTADHAGRIVLKGCGEAVANTSTAKVDPLVDHCVTTSYEVGGTLYAKYANDTEIKPADLEPQS